MVFAEFYDSQQSNSQTIVPKRTQKTIKQFIQKSLNNKPLI